MKIALVQSPLVWGKLQENLQNFDKKMAKSEDCDVILLPEMFTSGCMMIKKSAEVAFAAKESVANAYPVVEEKMLAWAKRQHALVMGSTVYRENGKYYNRLIAAFPEGNCRYYDKRHCFRMGGENEHFTPGDRQLTFEFRGVKIAAFICYDLRFPVWCRNTQNYDLAVFVANWPESRREVWMVADARGREVGSTSPGNEAIIRVELDIEKLRQFRKKFPVLDDRDDFLFREK